MDAKRAASLIFGHPKRRFSVELWDGSVLPPTSGPSPGRVILKAPSALDLLFPPASERRLAEAFVAGTIELEGSTIELLEAVAEWPGPHLSGWLVGRTLQAWLRRLFFTVPRAPAAHVRGRMHSSARDRDAVRHHYDVSNDFYKIFLDSELVYSCAYFPTGSESLEEAQRAKLDLICQKLSLRPNERLLDIGCGWGGLLLHAGRDYGAQGLGLTLSENQRVVAKRRLARLSVPMEVLRSDYRELDLDGGFDKVASVGMMEHVGRGQLDRYFSKVYGLLRPGGLFLNHAIADIAVDVKTVDWAARWRRGFIQTYIFPDSDLVPIGLVIEAAERAGFEVRDLESLREHYAETLACWLSRLEAHFDDAVSIAGPERARAWRLYLAASAVAFRRGRVSVFQLLLAKRLPNGRVADIPRSRAPWYPEQRSQSDGPPTAGVDLKSPSPPGRGLG